MTKLEIKGDWNVIRGKFKQMWGKPTNDDLQFVLGKQDKLSEKTQKRTGISSEELKQMIRESRSFSICR